MDKHLKRVKTLEESTITSKSSHRLLAKPGHNFSKLSRILEIDEEERTATVEPGVTFAALLKATLKFRLMPPVVPEFKMITVGGAIMGGALESSSFRYGQVCDCALAYECLLADGSIIWATPTENSDLFYGMSGSYGTLATITTIRLTLIPAKPYVTIHCVKKPHLDFKFNGDFAEAILLPNLRYLHLEATLEQKATAPLTFDKGGFYQYLIDRNPREISLKLTDYLFRFDLGAFWMSHYVPDMALLRNLLLGRRGIAKLHQMHGWRKLFLWPSKTLYRFLHAMSVDRFEDLFFIHDYYVPTKHVSEAISLITRKTGIFPLWLCPVRGTTKPKILSPHFGEASFVNIGCYGVVKKGAKACAIEIENQILSLGGRKMLYSLTYYNKEKFNKIYGDKLYSILRKKYNAQANLPTLYEKITH